MVSLELGFVPDSGVDLMDKKNSFVSAVGGRRLTVIFGQLQHAVAAADHGSFRQAAHTLSMKQSTLSRSIQLLENSFGVIIFERSSGGVSTAEPIFCEYLSTTGWSSRLSWADMIADLSGSPPGAERYWSPRSN
jgi:hypothetical protein